MLCENINNSVARHFADYSHLADFCGAPAQPSNVSSAERPKRVRLFETNT